MIRRAERGFTIVEAVISVTVIAIIVGFIFNYVLGSIQQSAISSNRSMLTKEVEQSLDLVTNDTRLSANADQDNRWPDPHAPGGSGDQFSWHSDDDTLVLATAAEDQSGSVIFSDPHNYITQKNNIIYFVQDGTLYKRVIAAPVSDNETVTTCPAASASAGCPADKELLHGVTQFSIKYLNGQNQQVTPTDARSVEIHLTASKPAFKQPVTVDYTTRMVFRNG